MSINNTKKYIFSIFFLAVFGFITLLFLSFINLNKVKEENTRIEQASKKLTLLQNIAINIRTIESGQRGFVISGNEEFLMPYHIAIKNIDFDTSQLHLILSSPNQIEKRDSLLLLIKKKIKHSEKNIKLRNEQGAEIADASVSQKEGLRLMNLINNQLQYFTNEQLTDINKYNKENEILNKKRQSLYLIVFFSIMLISSATFFLFKKGIEKQKENEYLLSFNSIIMSNLYDPVITTDINYLITSWNKNAEILFGYSEQEVLQKRLKDVLKSSSERESIEEIRKIISEKSRWNGDIVYRSKSNELIYANVSTSLLHDEQGNPNGTVSIIRDLTEKNLAEKKLLQLTESQESALDKKIAELKTVFNRTTDAFVSFDKNLNYIYVNEKAASLHNTTVASMVGKNILSFTPETSNQKFYESLVIALKDKKELHNEIKHEYTGQWFENWIYPDEEGVSVFYREITSRKNTEENLLATNKKLEELNKRFELVLTGSKDAIWDWNLENNDVWGNDKYLELLKGKPEHTSNFDYFLERIHPEDFKLGFELMNDCITEKKPVLTNEYRFLNPDNEWIYLYNRQIFLYNNEEKPYRILGTLQDITEQKKIQQQIIHEKEMSDTLINSLPGVFYMFNKDGKFIRWNKNIKNISGYNDEEMKLLHPTAFVPEDQKNMLAEKIANVFHYGIDYAEAYLLTKDNRRIPYYFTGMYTKYNGEDCMMGVGIDISDRIRIQEELRELSGHLQNIREEERARISREIHDELGQQLTGMKLNLSWLNKKLKDAPVPIATKINDLMELSENSIKWVRQIATQLRPTVLDDLGLIAALEWQSEEFQKRYDTKVDFVCSHNNLSLSKDMATAIFRIYQESLTNIARHAAASEVNAVLSVEKDMLIFEVSDNGVGFDMNELSNKKTLGLTGIRERTLMLNGSYQLHSERGKGTNLLIKMPLNS